MSHAAPSAGPDYSRTDIQWNKLDSNRVKEFKNIRIYPRDKTGERVILPTHDLVHELKRGNEVFPTRTSVDLDDHSLGVTVTPKKAGPHTLSIGYKIHTGDGEDDFTVVPFPLSPYEFLVEPNDDLADQDQSLVLELPDTAVVNVPFSFTIHLKNSKGVFVNGGDLEVSVKFGEWGSLGWNRSFLDDGIAKIGITPTEPGHHTVTVTIDDIPLKPTPHVFNVVAADRQD